MSLNIYMDVDDALLNSNEGVDLRADETLRQIVLKLRGDYPDSDLYLWSGAGGAYAKEMADKHGLAGLFKAFLGKPDVVIDDKPSSVFPRRAVVWKGDVLWQKIIPTISTEFSPSTKLIEWVAEIQESVRISDNECPDLYPTDNQGNQFLRHPVPFSGDLENAEVLTLGVNPSAGEFVDRFSNGRDWSDEMSAAQLSLRLVNYFRHWNPPPHAWFTSLKTILRRNHCSYLFNTAHIDFSPRATRGMKEFSDEPEHFLDMVNRDALEWLPKILSSAKKLKKIRIRWKIVPHGYWPYLANYVRNNLPAIWSLIEQYDPERI